MSRRDGAEKPAGPFAPLTLRALLFGCVAGMFLCVVNVLVALKTGLGFGGAQVAALGGFVWLTATGRYARGENNVIQACASGAYLSMFAMDSAVAALLMFRGRLVPVAALFGLTLSAALAGVALAWLLRRPLVLEAALPYPTGTSTAHLIDALAQVGGRRFRRVMAGAVAGAAVSALVQAGTVPGSLPGALLGWPGFLGLAVSPLVLGMGYVIGLKAAALVGAGAALSCLVWALAEGCPLDLPFSQHLAHPWVMSPGTALMLTSAVVILVQNRRALLGLRARLGLKPWKRRGTPPARGAGRDGVGAGAVRGQAPRPAAARSWGWALGGLGVLAVAALGLRAVADRPAALWPALAVALPLCLCGAVFSARASGETGMVPVTSLGVITFIAAAPLVRDWAAVLFAGAFVAASGLAAMTMMNTFKAGSLLETDPRALVLAQAVGAAAGSLAGTAGICAMARAYRFGSEGLPAPVSAAWGALLSGLVQGRVPASINLAVAGAFGAAAAGLQLAGVSAVSVGIGVMIPPAYSAVMLLGALWRRAEEALVRRRGRPAEDAAQSGQSLAAGLIVGQGLVDFAALVLKAWGG
ncbi:MAG: OPT/YSL family transporter [Acetobacteraceae bacterium]|nr:OPT/YSL family transporter [Acetobacteraceae bacterium]